jgi:hypothetical protein
MKARLPEGVSDEPTTQPDSLIASATLEVPPGTVPRLRMPAVAVHRKALIPFWPLENPTTWPALLIANA